MTNAENSYPLRASSTCEAAISLSLICALVLILSGSFVPYALFVNPRTTVGVFILWSGGGLVGGIVAGGLLARRIHRRLAGRSGLVRLEGSRLSLERPGRPAVSVDLGQPHAWRAGFHDEANTGGSVATRTQGVTLRATQGEVDLLLWSGDGVGRGPELGLPEGMPGRPWPESQGRLYTESLCLLIEEAAQERK